MKPYANIFYQPGENPVFCYRNGMTVYEEVLYKGALVSGGWNGAGYPQNVLTNCPSRLNPALFREPFAFNLDVNGQCLDYDLELVDFVWAEEAEGTHSCLILQSKLLPVEIGVHTLTDGTGMFSRWLRVENKSDAPMTISRLSVLAGGVEASDMFARSYDNDPAGYYEIGYFDNDHWGREGEFNWHSLTPGTHNVDFRYFRDRYRHPLLFLKNKVEGTIWFYQIAWSAGCRFSLDYQALREASNRDFAAVPRLAMKAEITGTNPLYLLEPGKVLESPVVHMGCVKGDLDDAVNAMHAHIRRSVLNLSAADASACTVGAGMGAEHDMSVETSKAFIDQFTEMGAEVFIIDAGWQNPPHREMEWGPYNGINHPNPQRYPNGLSELSDCCHEKGMKFALWVEIERMGEYSDVFKAHPDWRARNVYGEYPQQNNGFLDFTNPAAAAWAEAELARIIEEYKLDLLRVDYNIGPDEYFNMRDVTGEGIRECVALRHFQAVYRMYQNLKTRFPEVIFENCAGGGGRTDLGMMRAFHHTWVSDWQKMPHSALITNGMTMALPPERVDRLFAGMGCHEFGALDAHMRNVMLGHMSLNVVAPAATTTNPIQMEFVRHSVAIYKDFIRPILPTCRIFHHTPETRKIMEEGWMVMEIASPNGDKGAATLFTMPGLKSDRYTFLPRGVDAGKTYRVTLDNSRQSFTVEGWKLLSEGIPIRIPGSMASELVLYQEV
ncbi:MAG: hypothetical protein E7428_07390 [Ruminococcaceae bacterium]|nr:hypothetical protein [Oscillospiraceae bacterium]